VAAIGATDQANHQYDAAGILRRRRVVAYDASNDSAGI
jgi:hypothetical protein